MPRSTRRRYDGAPDPGPGLALLADREVSNAVGDSEVALDAGFVRRWVEEIAAGVEQERDHLTQLDSAIGDADHGVNLSRGFTAAVDELDGYDARTVGDVLVRTGNTLVS